MTAGPPTLVGMRLRLEPLRVEDADEMVVVLADRSLYAFTGGEPPDVATLRQRYGAQVGGASANGDERWLNWIVRRREEGDSIGYVQATLTAPGGTAPLADVRDAADVAWVVGVAWQGHGYATEAARLMVDWLVGPEPTGAAVASLTAHVRADHAASAAVARGLGLRATELIEDGEVVWRAGAGRVRLVRLAAWAAEIDGRNDEAGTWEGGQRGPGGTIQVPYVVLSERILAFVREMTSLGWVRPFDWPAWAASPDGRRLLGDRDLIATAPADDLWRLLTTIVRGDRFAEGQLLHAAESGMLVAIARRAAVLAAETDDC